MLKITIRREKSENIKSIWKVFKTLFIVKHHMLNHNLKKNLKDPDLLNKDQLRKNCQ